MGAKSCHGAVNQSPPAVNPSRQQRRVLILRRHDDAEPLKALEIPGQRQGDSWTASRKRRVRYSVLLEFRDVSDAGIFDAPYLFRIVVGVCRQRRFGVDSPSVNAIGGSRGAQVRQASPVFHPAEQQSIAVGQTDRSCVKDAVDRIRPVALRQDRVA